LLEVADSYDRLAEPAKETLKNSPVLGTCIG